MFLFVVLKAIDIPTQYTALQHICTKTISQNLENITNIKLLF